MKRIKVKQISFILLCLIVSIAYSKNIVNNKKTINTMSVPVSNKTIILDAGHGIPDEGAKGINGTTEQEINLKIVLKIQNLLESSGSNVILTRSDENGIYDLDKKTIREMKVSDIKKRVKIGNNSNADIFVSIHLNKTDEEEWKGWQTFYKNNNDEGKNLATEIQNNLNVAIQKENKRVALKIDNVYIIKHIEIPTTIVECGFLSNEEEERLLKTDEYQNKLAWGIYNGIMDYFNKK